MRRSAGDVHRLGIGGDDERRWNSHAGLPAAAPVTVGTIVVPVGPVSGSCQSELVMAAHIMTAARDQGIGTHTQAVGVMMAIGEPGLRSLAYCDAACPDSRGLFQERDNGAWGTFADRMERYIPAPNVSPS